MGKGTFYKEVEVQQGDINITAIIEMFGRGTDPWDNAEQRQQFEDICSIIDVTAHVPQGLPSNINDTIYDHPDRAVFLGNESEITVWCKVRTTNLHKEATGKIVEAILRQFTVAVVTVLVGLETCSVRFGSLIDYPPPPIR